jgi:hypothetical protein
MTKTFYMVHGNGEFYTTVIALFPGQAEADTLAAEHPTEWQVSVVEVAVPFTLVTEAPFTPA